MEPRIIKVLLLTIHIVCGSLPNGMACYCVQDSKLVCSCVDLNHACSGSTCCESNSDCSPADSSGNPQDSNCACCDCECYFVESEQAKWKPSDEPVDVACPWVAPGLDALLVARTTVPPFEDAVRHSSHAERQASLCVWRN